MSIHGGTARCDERLAQIHMRQADWRLSTRSEDVAWLTWAPHANERTESHLSERKVTKSAILPEPPFIHFQWSPVSKVDLAAQPTTGLDFE